MCCGPFVISDSTYIYGLCIVRSVRYCKTYVPRTARLALRGGRREGASARCTPVVRTLCCSVAAYLSGGCELNRAATKYHP